MPAKRNWTEEENQFIKDNYPKLNIEEIAKILNSSQTAISRKINELNIKRYRPQIGDIVNGWLIIDIYLKDSGTQKITMAKVIAQEGESLEKEFRLTKLTLNQVGRPIRLRPDLSERNKKHGLSGTRLHRIWLGLLNRCNPKLSNLFSRYSARGISLYKDWYEFINFYNWSIQNGYQDNLTIDRINNDGNYEPSNCKWSTVHEQAINKSNIPEFDINTKYTAFGESKNIYEWAIDPKCKCKLHNLKYRFKKGWDTERALTEKVQDQCGTKLEEWLELKYPNIYQEYIRTERI